MGTEQEEDAAILRDAAARVANAPPAEQPAPRGRFTSGGWWVFVAVAAAVIVFTAGRYHCVTNTHSGGGGFAVISKTEWGFHDQVVDANNYRGEGAFLQMITHPRTAGALMHAGILERPEPIPEIPHIATSGAPRNTLRGMFCSGSECFLAPEECEAWRAGKVQATRECRWVAAYCFDADDGTSCFELRRDCDAERTKRMKTGKGARPRTACSKR